MRVGDKKNGEEEETRTPTSQLTLPPQSSASTNSATSPTYYYILTKRVPRTGLEPARLAAHAPETCASTNSATWALSSLFVQSVSGKRDSDPRPQPWQGCALPTELFPQNFLVRSASLSIADAKVLLFSEPPKLFTIFFQKKREKEPLIDKKGLLSVWRQCRFYGLTNTFLPSMILTPALGAESCLPSIP